MEMKELIEGAIKNERKNQKIYEALMSLADNPVFMERLGFIMAEEEWQEEMLQHLCKSRFGEECKVEVEVPAFEGTLDEMIQKALDEELSSREMYIALYDATDEKDTELRKLFYYFVRMELTHYQILEAELEVMEMFEEGKYWSEIMEKEVKE